MWLINVETRKLEEYFGSNIPPYAILSHTWEEEEVSHKQYVSGTYEHLKGYGKIDMTCRIAERQGIKHCWVDTICIDKSSSAELSEAINSMFRWYQRAEICYVYLSDLVPGTDWAQRLENCRWFTRGWTLQELIAPAHVVFFDSFWLWDYAEWEPGRSKNTKADLVALISSITKIDQHLLVGWLPLHSYSVAQRFSWASRRQTTRIEDMTYCLLGIFDLNMPLLYGEEEKAFQRLQEEIIRSSADLSILAWTATPKGPSQTYSPLVSSVFAKSPADFSHCGAYERMLSSEICEFSISNTGMKIRTNLPSHYGLLEEVLYIYELPLDCCENGKELSIHLRKIGRHQYLRRDPGVIVDYKPAMFSASPLLDLYLLTRLPQPFSHEVSVPMETLMKSARPHTLEITLPATARRSGMWPPDSFDNEDKVFFINGNAGHNLNIMNFSWRPDDTGSNKMLPGLVDCSIIALNWAASNREIPQFSIVNSTEQDDKLRVIRDYTAENIPSTEFLIRQITEADIPRSHQLVVYLRGCNQATVLTIVPRIESKQIAGCKIRYCSEVRIHGKVFDKDSIPEVQPTWWDWRDKK